MNYLVKLLTTDDRDKIEDPKWCLVDPTNHMGPATLCTSDFFGCGESACEYEEKEVQRGGITCESCLEKIKTIKAIRL
jgi:hypothetical protein